MWTRAARWAVAALVGSAMTTVGCARARAMDEPVRVRQPIVADDILVEVVDGVVNLTGQVWTPLEKQRAADLVRHVAGVIDVANHLDVRPPE